MVTYLNCRLNCYLYLSLLHQQSDSIQKILKVINGLEKDVFTIWSLIFIAKQYQDFYLYEFEVFQYFLLLECQNIVVVFQLNFQDSKHIIEILFSWLDLSSSSDF